MADRDFVLKFDLKDGFDLPPREEWPEMTDPYMVTDAIVFLLLSDVVYILGGDTAPTLHVNCNDLFYWACADCEPLPFVGFGLEHNREVLNLYNTHRAHPGGFGAAKWACLRRKMRPQRPFEELMRKSGAWDADLEALPVREDS